MKKAITILLAAVLMLSLVACSGGKEEMLEEAQELDSVDLMQAINENIVRAEQTYNGNTYVISGYILNIGKDNIDIGIYSKNENSKLYQSGSSSHWENIDALGMVNVELASDVTATLNKDEKITVVGKIDINDGFPVMKNAYYIDNVFEITGKIMNNYIFDDSCVILSDDAELICVYLEKSDLENLGDGYEITVSGQMDNKTLTTIDGISIPYTLTNAHSLNIKKTEEEITGEISSVNAESPDDSYCKVTDSDGNEYRLYDIETEKTSHYRYAGKTYYPITSVIISGESVEIGSNITVSGILSGYDLKEVTLLESTYGVTLTGALIGNPTDKYWNGKITVEQSDVEYIKKGMIVEIDFKTGEYDKVLAFKEGDILTFNGRAIYYIGNVGHEAGGGETTDEYTLSNAKLIETEKD